LSSISDSIEAVCQKILQDGKLNLSNPSPPVEISIVLVRLDHVASVIVNANHCIM
jgi:hypothetical protein